MIDKLGVKSYIFIQTVKPLKSLLTKTCHSSLGSREEVQHRSRIWEIDDRKRQTQTAVHTRPIHSIETFFKEMAQSHCLYIHRASECLLYTSYPFDHEADISEIVHRRPNPIISSPCIDTAPKTPTYLSLYTTPQAENTKTRKHDPQGPPPPLPPGVLMRPSNNEGSARASERYRNPSSFPRALYTDLSRTRDKGENSTPRSRVDGAGI